MANSEEEDPYAEFLIIDRNYQYKTARPNYLTLMDSASFSDYEVEFYLNMTQTTFKNEYSVMVGGIPENFPPATGSNQWEAYDKAAQKAIECLSRRCYTVKYRAHQPEITLDDIFKDLLTPDVPQSSVNLKPTEGSQMPSINSESSQVVPANTESSQKPPINSESSQVPSVNNKRQISSILEGPETVASKMLKMMGWDGGALGRTGVGIVEPISSSLVVGRFGLGHLQRKETEVEIEKVGEVVNMKDNKKKKKRGGGIKPLPKAKSSIKKISDERFTRRAHLIVQDFVENSDHEDLIFSTNLNGLQRKIIHNLAPQYNLTSISFGLKQSRHLVLFRARSVSEFIDNCKAKSSFTSNFSVIPPSEEQNTPTGIPKATDPQKMPGRCAVQAIPNKKPDPVPQKKRVPVVPQKKPVSVVPQKKPVPVVPQKKPVPVVPQKKPNPVVYQIKPEERVVVKEDLYLDFIILDRCYTFKNRFECSDQLTLEDSANFAGYEVRYVILRNEPNNFEYAAAIEGSPRIHGIFPPSSGKSKRMAKNMAAKTAVQYLSHFCYTIKYLNHQEGIAKTDFLKNIPGTIEPQVNNPPSSNMPVSGNVKRKKASKGNTIQPVPSAKQSLNVPRTMKQQTISQPMIGPATTLQQKTSQPQKGHGKISFISAGLKEENKVSECPRTMHSVANGPEIDKMSPNALGPETQGFKMMKKMGWVGGGLGKDCRGISKPIAPSQIIGRFGIGYSRRIELENRTEQKVQQDVKNKKNTKPQEGTGLDNEAIKLQYWVNKFIEDFMKQSEYDDLILGHKLFKNQKDLIQQVAMKHNLQMILFGEGKSSHFVLFKPNSPKELLASCLKKIEGNVPVNFKVMPPLADQ